MMRTFGGPLVAAALAGLAVAPSGCSYAFSQPPPPRPLRWVGECSTSRLPVVGDVYLAVNTTAVALFGFLGASIAASQRSDEIVPSWNTRSDSTSTTTTFLLIGALGTAATVGLIKSANHGLRSARGCDAAQFSLLRQQAGWGVPPAWTWPAVPPPAPPPYAPPAVPQAPAPDAPPAVPPPLPPAPPQGER